MQNFQGSIFIYTYRIYGHIFKPALVYLEGYYSKSNLCKRKQQLHWFRYVVLQELSKFFTRSNSKEKQNCPHENPTKSAFWSRIWRYLSWVFEHRPKVLQEGVLRTCSKITREHQCWNVISIKFHKSLFNSFSPVYLLGVFKASLCKHTSLEGIFYTKYYSAAPIFTKSLSLGLSINFF